MRKSGGMDGGRHGRQARRGECAENIRGLKET